MLKSIDAVFISTTKMGELIEFYQALGVPLKVNDHGGGLHAEADFGGVHFALQTWEFQDSPKNNITISFHVPNLEEYCEELKSKGMNFAKPPIPMPFGGVIAVLNDPDGNQIFLNRWQTDDEYKQNFPRSK